MCLNLSPTKLLVTYIESIGDKVEMLETIMEEPGSLSPPPCDWALTRPLSPFQNWNKHWKEEREPRIITLYRENKAAYISITRFSLLRLIEIGKEVGEQ